MMTGLVDFYGVHAFWLWVAIAAAVLDDFDSVFLLVALALIVLWKHRENIERLIQGSEPRVGAKKDG